MAGWSGFLSPSTVRALALVVMGTAIFAFGNYIVTVSIPEIIVELDGVRWISWFASLFTGAAIIASLASPGLVTRWSAPRALLGAALVYALGAALCALAANIGMLLAGRVLLGLGGGFAFGFSAVFIRRTFNERDWPKAFSAISIAFGMSAVLGPLIGGWLAELGHWRAGFWLLTGMGGLYALIGRFALQGGRAARFDDRDVEAKLPMRRLTLIGFVVLVVASANQMPLPLAVLLVLIGLAAFLWFLKLDQVANSAPLLPANPFKQGTVIGAGFSFILMISATTIAFFTYGTFLLTEVFDLSAVWAGYIVVLETFGWSISATIVAGLSDRQGDKLVRLGPWVVVVGTVLLASGFGLQSLSLVVLGALLSGIGMGVAYSNLTRLMVLSLAEAEQDVASAAVVTIQQLGFVIGAGLTGLIANGLMIESVTSSGDAGRLGFWLIAVFLPGAVYAAWQTRHLRLI